ncbi:recombinase family protein [Chryseobacterium sp. 2987]|uniref:recombinase family protein n=1 Tax=Chryseobacterium sp. 2987 TaxID=2817767 RepID=UPI0028673548|nr:recombinase family protein [Chryseobacterium sp. 2987]MDR6921225.1 DNA invertase Pin-like site-specific DNA recombinase [Chryseobacterium sp. 2987]
MLGIYARISKEKEEGKDRSINDQVELGKSLANKLGISYNIYIDEGYSGSLDIDNRPGLANLVEDIFDNKITHVFSFDQSRLERNNDIWAKLYNLFQNKKVRLFYNGTGEFDFNSDENYLQSHIISLMNNFYIKIGSRKIKSVLKRNIEAGKVHAIPPYGYKKDSEGFLVIDEQEKEIIHKIFSLSLEGKGTDTIANVLNDTNIPTSYNKIGKGVYTTKNKYTGEIKEIKKIDAKWRGNTIRSILKNTIYKGQRKWKDEIFESPIVISEELWDKVNENLINNSNNTGKKVNYRYLLKGLIRCGKCGRNMVGRSRENKKDHAYQCSSKRYKGESCGNRSINIDKIEGIVWSRFFKGSDLLNLLQKDISMKRDNKESISENIFAVRKQLSNLQQQKDNLIIAVSKGLLSEEEIKKQKNSIDSEIRGADILLKDYELQLSNVVNSDELINNYEEEFEQFTDSLSFLEQKEIVNKYIQNIKVISSEKNQDVYSLIIRFKIKSEEEHYLFFRKKDLLYSITDNELLFSKYFNSKAENMIDFIESSILEKIIFIPSEEKFVLPPYIQNGENLQIISNSIYPYGNIQNWTSGKIIEFYSKNPELLCKDSGLSTLSVAREKDSYAFFCEEYKLYKNKPLASWVNIWLKNQALFSPSEQSPN